MHDKFVIVEYHN